MIVLTNDTVQTIPPGESAVFDTVVVKTGCGECHRKNSGSVKLRQNGTYTVAFTGVIGGPAGTQANAAIALGGETLPETVRTVTITAATDVFTVAAVTGVPNCCCDYDRVTVVNTGTTDITLTAPALYIHREG